MGSLKKNIKYLWHKRDISGEVFLCLYSFRSANIHVRIVKGDTSGEYFVSCYSPAFRLHGFDLRQLLVMIFVELQKLTNDPYHKNTVRRMLDFFSELKNEPELFFSG
jgi:hypothetical protein